MTAVHWRGMAIAALLMVLLATAWRGPLRAQETAAPPAQATEEEEAGEQPADEENVSADNSLSFPVDI